MTEMIDRVARALWAHDARNACRGKSDLRTPWAECPKAELRLTAGAILVGMREPTKPMVEAGDPLACAYDGCVEAYRAMIDAALQGPDR